MEAGMNTISSPDGTKIAYDQEGTGPALILIDGAMCTRSSGAKPELVSLVSRHFTVYSYDRRGRGDSGDTLPYAADREIEDIEALIGDAGGTAYLFGHSSGACLALEAAVKLGSKVTGLAMYDAPYNDDASARQAWREYLRQLTGALAAGHRGDAVALFMRYVGMPDAQIEGMRQTPFWPAAEAIAPTLAYDHAGVMGEDASVPTGLAARADVPALVISGGAGPPFMNDTAAALSRAMPHAQHRILEGQTHDMNPAVLGPLLVEFFGS
jgi:pimeloyl-ACP methyl ester carboxylesterase